MEGLFVKSCEGAHSNEYFKVPVLFKGKKVTGWHAAPAIYPLCPHYACNIGPKFLNTYFVKNT
jgi:hypothetical protein